MEKRRSAIHPGERMENHIMKNQRRGIDGSINNGGAQTCLSLFVPIKTAG